MKFNSKFAVFSSALFTPILFYSYPLLATAVNNINTIAMPAKQAQKESLFSLLVKGGPIMIPLAICSVLALTFFIERIVSLRKNCITPDYFYPELKEQLDGFRLTGLKQSTSWCSEKNLPIARIIRAGIRKCISVGAVNVVEETLEDISSREVRKMRNSLKSLKIIASISPLLGLLGTVYGMITAFQSVANMSAGIGKAESLANGIYEAMVTTAAGLTIAIPVLLAYSYLNYRLNRQVNEIEVICDQFIDDYVDSLHDNNFNKRKTDLIKR